MLPRNNDFRLQIGNGRRGRSMDSEEGREDSAGELQRRRGSRREWMREKRERGESHREGRDSASCWHIRHTFLSPFQFFKFYKRSLCELITILNYYTAPKTEILGTPVGIAGSHVAGEGTMSGWYGTVYDSPWASTVHNHLIAFRGWPAVGLR